MVPTRPMTLALCLIGLPWAVCACGGGECPEGQASVQGGACAPVWGDDDDTTEAPFDDDDTTADDDDTTAPDDDDTGPEIALDGGWWEFDSPPSVTSDACGLSPNPHGIDGFEVTPTPGKLYQLVVPELDVTIHGCQVVGGALLCPPDEVDQEPLSSDNVDVEARHSLTADVDSGTHVEMTLVMELDCEGSGCGSAAAALGLEFPCELRSEAPASWSSGIVPGDDDDIGDDDDDTGPPDISPDSVDGLTLPATFEAGTLMSVGYTYSNDGGLATLSSESPLVNGLHLSTSTDVADSVVLLLQGSRTSDLSGGGSSYLAPTTITLAAPAATYQVLLEVDALDNVPESDESDNLLVAGQLTVTPSGSPEGNCSDDEDNDFDGSTDCADADCEGVPACDPDIVPLEVTGAALPTSVQQGSTLIVGYTYANEGGGETTTLAPKNPLVTSVHLSTSSSVFDSVRVLVSANRESDLLPGQLGFLTPVAAVVTADPGTYQVLLEVDVENAVAESDEGNNVLVAGTLSVTE